jgi:hypothetical protein
MGLKMLHHKKKQSLTKSYTGPRTDSLELPTQRKVGVRFGTWNVRSPYRLGLLTTDKMNLRVIGWDCNGLNSSGSG